QVVITDNSLIGDGTIGDTLKVNWDTLGAYYDTLVLQTPGFARIDWQNIVNVPDSVIADGDSTNELIDSMQWRDAGAGTLAVFERHDTVKISIPFRADSLEDNVIGDLGNVSESGVEDGQVLKWFASAGEWRPANDIGGGLGDNWGTQTVVSDSSLAGDGTASDPLRLAAITDSSLIGRGTADKPLGINFPNIDFVQDFIWEPDSAPEHTLRIVQASGNDDVIIPVEDDDLSDNKLTDLGDVYADTAALNNILVYDGTRWVLHSGAGLLDDINWNDSIEYIVAAGSLRTRFRIFNRMDTVSFLSYQEDSISSGIWYGGKVIRIGNVNSKGYGLYASARAYSGLGADTTVSQFYGVYGSAAYGKINYGVYGSAEDVGAECTGIGVYGRGANFGGCFVGVESDSNHAPLKVETIGTGQSLLIDGNGIDCFTGPLYIQANSGGDTKFLGHVGVWGDPVSSAALTIEPGSDYDGVYIHNADVGVSLGSLSYGIAVGGVGTYGFVVYSSDMDAICIYDSDNKAIFAIANYAGADCSNYNTYDYSASSFWGWHGSGVYGENSSFHDSYDGIGVYGKSYQGDNYGFGVVGTGGYVGGLFDGGDHDYGGPELMRTSPDGAGEKAVGLGVWGQGGVSGGVFTGGYFGQIVYGKEISSYSLSGDEVMVGNSVELHDTGGTQFAVEYHTVSPQPAVYASGYGKLVHGRAEVKFPEGFSAVIDRDKKPVVTVTPVGECNGIHIVRITDKGFEVRENGGGISDVEFTWIAVGEKSVEPLPSEVISRQNYDKMIEAFVSYHPDYDLKMSITHDGQFEFRYDQNGFQSEEDSLRWEEMRQREMREREQSEHRIEKSKNSGALEPPAVPQKEENR
ncbi:hypothetical protein J7K99_07785, partial [bacterium]|nr:hypothetical protein [bacterium]